MCIRDSMYNVGDSIYHPSLCEIFPCATVDASVWSNFVNAYYVGQCLLCDLLAVLCEVPVVIAAGILGGLYSAVIASAVIGIVVPRVAARRTAAKLLRQSLRPASHRNLVWHHSALTALHWMRRGLVARKVSVCLSVCLSVSQTRGLWQNGKKICPDFYTTRKIM